MHKLRSFKALIIALIWLVGFLVGSPVLYASKIVTTHRYNIIQYHCTEDWSTEMHGKIFTVAIFLATFFVPMLILVLVYSRIWGHLVDHVTPGNPDHGRDQQQNNRKCKVSQRGEVSRMELTVGNLSRHLQVLHILIPIVVMFFICWFPIQLFQLVVYFKPTILKAKNHKSASMFYIVYFITHFISMAHSLVNPIVYCYMSQNFRVSVPAVIKLTPSPKQKNCLAEKPWRNTCH